MLKKELTRKLEQFVEHKASLDELKERTSSLEREILCEIEDDESYSGKSFVVDMERKKFVVLVRHSFHRGASYLSILEIME